MNLEQVERDRKWTEVTLEVLNFVNADDNSQKILVKDGTGRTEWIKQKNPFQETMLDNDNLSKAMLFRVRKPFMEFEGYPLEPKQLGELP